MMNNLYEEFDLSEAIIEEGVFCNIIALSPKSKNNRTYSQVALTEAAEHLSGVPVYVNHGSKSRNYEDRIGYATNSRFDGTCVRIDLKCNSKHKLYEQIKWDIENKSPKVGLSIHGDGKVTKNGTTTIVESVTNITSVDVVDNPAATSSFREQTEEQNILLSEHIDNIKKLEEKITLLEKEVEVLKQPKVQNPLNKPVNINKFDFNEFLTDLRKNK